MAVALIIEWEHALAGMSDSIPGRVDLQAIIGAPTAIAAGC